LVQGSGFKGSRFKGSRFRVQRFRVQGLLNSDFPDVITNAINGRWKKTISE
jgi:hypothetical protein